MGIYRGDRITSFYPLPEEDAKYCKLIISKGRFVRYKGRIYGLAFIDEVIVLEKVLVKDFTEEIEIKWNRQVREYNERRES